VLGSVLGPHPYPSMVKGFQSVIGKEARAQILKAAGRLPYEVAACVGGGSNAIGIFSAFAGDRRVRLTGVEGGGKGVRSGRHAARFAGGRPGVLHGCFTYLLQDEKGEPLPVHSIASGLDYPGVGPNHAHLKDTGRVEYVCANDQEALDAFMELSKTEGIIPALESAHAIAHAMKLAPTLSKEEIMIVNLSGRGDKDVDFVAERLNM